MKIANGLFIICLGLIAILLSPEYGKNGGASMSMIIVGIIIILIGAIFVFYCVHKNKQDKSQGGQGK